MAEGAGTHRLGWDVAVLHDSKSNDSDSDTVATTVFGSYSSAMATIYLNVNTSEVRSGRDFLARVAFHEVCHILLSGVSHCVESRFDIHEKVYEEELHRLITILENTMWEKYQGSKS